MHPSITFFGRVIPSYGVLGAAGSIAGLLLAILIAKKRHETMKYIDDLVYVYVFGLIGAMVGAKILYLLTVLPEFLRDLPVLFKQPNVFLKTYFAGGFVFYGGAIGAVVTAYQMASSYGRSLKEFYPSLLPAMAVVSGFGRIGCFMTGCCYGAKVSPDCPIAVIFPVGGLAPEGVPLLPVQLIEATYDFLLVLVMLYITNSKKWKPYALPLYAILYAVMRFILEFFRGDVVRGVWMGISTSQWISAAILVGCVIWIQHQKSHKFILQAKEH